jgi:hypothetical protein
MSTVSVTRKGKGMKPMHTKRPTKVVLNVLGKKSAQKTAAKKVSTAREGDVTLTGQFLERTILDAPGRPLPAKERRQVKALVRLMRI